MKLYKFFEYAYIAIAIWFIGEAVVIWSTDRGRSYLLLAFAAVALLLFIFKKRFRRKIEDNNRQQ
jgi:uncharacterized membrane protein